MTQVNLGGVFVRGENGRFEPRMDLLEQVIRDYNPGSWLNSPYSVSDDQRRRLQEGPSVEGATGWNAEEWQDIIEMLQNTTARIALQEGRTFVPILFGLDSVHGANYVRGY
jgi:hypothetical protein